MPPSEILKLGTTFQILAQLSFFFGGFLISIFAAHNVSAENYGRFGVVMSIMGISYVFLSAGIPDALSKIISEGKNQYTMYLEALQFQLLLFQAPMHLL